MLETEVVFYEEFSLKCQELHLQIQKCQTLLFEDKLIKSDSRINIEN